jgi:short chain dehydrogenase
MLGGRAAAVQMDVTDTASIGKAVDSAELAFGPVSVLINNAGIAIEKLSTEQTEADWDAVINANLKGAYFLATEMARRMIARKQEGNIVNIASVLGQSVMKFLSPYTISKAGIIRQGDGAGTRRQPDPRQCAGAGLHRHRDEPRILGDAGGREIDKTDSAAPGRCRIRSRRRHPAAGLRRLALHDRQRGDGRWRVFAELRPSIHVIASQRVTRMRARCSSQ